MFALPLFYLLPLFTLQRTTEFIVHSSQQPIETGRLTAERLLWKNIGPGRCDHHRRQSQTECCIADRGMWWWWWWWRLLVTVLSNVDDDGLFPTEQEIPKGGTQDHRQTEPRVVRHEDQHQQEA